MSCVYSNVVCVRFGVLLCCGVLFVILLGVDLSM